MRNLALVSRKPFGNEPMQKFYLTNQVNCILSLDRNRQSDYRNVSELFDTYNQILEKETTSDFQKSMAVSRECIIPQQKEITKVYTSKLEELQANNVDSFLIVPMITTNHLFCAVIRKTNEGFSATLVNASKGGRRGDDRGNNAGYQEYTFAPENFSKLLQCVGQTALCYKNGYLTNGKVYQLFDKMSDAKYPLNIISRDQKDGNCFVKEPEKAIKYVFATRKFKPENLIKLRSNVQPPFKPKWNRQTVEIHRQYIDILKAENPNKAQDLERRFQKHLEYKYYVRETDGYKFNINGRSMIKQNKVEFQDNQGETKCTASKGRNANWTYTDNANKIIGYGIEEGNKTRYFDSFNEPLGFSVKEGVGEKFYDNGSRLKGYSRFHYGMQDYDGAITAEQKGSHPVDLMIELSMKKLHQKLLPEPKSLRF